MKLKDVYSTVHIDKNLKYLNHNLDNENYHWKSLQRTVGQSFAETYGVKIKKDTDIGCDLTIKTEVCGELHDLLALIKKETIVATSHPLVQKLLAKYEIE